jgi:hypothetical protein
MFNTLNDLITTELSNFTLMCCALIVAFLIRIGNTVEPNDWLAFYMVFCLLTLGYLAKIYKLEWEEVTRDLTSLAKRDFYRAFSKKNREWLRVDTFSPLINLYNDKSERSFLLKILRDDEYIEVHDIIQRLFAHGGVLW